MNVSAVLQQYPPRTIIGAYIATHRWLRGLAERGHQVTVHRTSQHPRGLREHVDGVTSVPPSGRSMWADDHPWRQADVIVSHVAGRSIRSNTAHKAAAEFRIPSVRIAHSKPVDGAAQMDGCSLLIANSQATVDAIGWDGPTVVCHPVTLPAEHRTNPGSRVTLVNLQPAKGGALFWKLAAELADLDFLAVSGWGTQEGPNGPLVTTEPRFLPPNVRWQRGTKDMRRDVWSDTRLLLVPSEREAWGMVAIEAMCSGIPVIAHPTPGLIEACGDAAMFVDRDDLDGWVDAIRAFDDPYFWLARSARALGRVAALNPQQSIDRFADAIEGVR